jgi:hypothetical protein
MICRQLHREVQDTGGVGQKSLNKAVAEQVEGEADVDEIGLDMLY